MILIVDCGSSKTKYIESLVDNYVDYEVMPIFNISQNDLENFNGVLISGAPVLMSESDPTPYLLMTDWIKSIEIPILGICFGHQLIGLHFGASVHRMKEDRDWQMIEVFQDCPLTQRLPSEFEMMEDHCETISIPPGFELIGSSDACINEIMMHRERPIYGVQFHPEVSGNYGAVLIESFVQLTEQ